MYSALLLALSLRSGLASALDCLGRRVVSILVVIVLVASLLGRWPLSLRLGLFDVLVLLEIEFLVFVLHRLYYIPFIFFLDSLLQIWRILGSLLRSGDAACFHER